MVTNNNDYYYINEFFAFLYAPFVSGNEGYIKMPSELTMTEVAKDLFDKAGARKVDDEVVRSACDEALKKCYRKITPWPKITNMDCYIDYLGFRPIKTSFNLYPYVHLKEYERYRQMEKDF